MLKVTDVSVKRRTDGKSYGNGSRTRIYFFVKDESVLENFFKRFSRPHKAYKAVLPTVFEKLGMPDYTKHCTWSQKAGCRCGCSPGFVINGGMSYGKDIFVDVSGAGADTMLDERSLEALFRTYGESGAGRVLNAIFDKNAVRHFGEDE